MRRTNLRNRCTHRLVSAGRPRAPRSSARCTRRRAERSPAPLTSAGGPWRPTCRGTCQGGFDASSTKKFSQVGTASRCLPRFIHRLPARACARCKRTRNPLVLQRFRASTTASGRLVACTTRTSRYSAPSPQGRGSSRWILAGPNERCPLRPRESASRQSPRPHRDGSPASVEAHPFPCISRLNWCVAPESGNG